MDTTNRPAALVSYVPLVGAVLVALAVLGAGTLDVFGLEAQVAAAIAPAMPAESSICRDLALTVEALRVLLSFYLLLVAVIVVRALALRLRGGPAAAYLMWDWASRLLLASGAAGFTRGLLVLVLMRLAVRLSERALGLAPASLTDWLFLAGACGVMLLALTRTTRGLIKQPV